MKPSGKNIEEENFLAAAADFGALALKDKSQFEIINSGLDIYKKIPGCRSASFFMLENEDYDFYYKASTAGIEEHEVKKIFWELACNGKIAGALNNGGIFESQNISTENNSRNYLIVTLPVQTGIIGLCLLIMEKDFTITSKIESGCKLFSNYFAQLINSGNLIKEISSIKDSAEQRIALRTNDYVQSTREIKAVLDAVRLGIIIVEKSSNKIAEVNSTAADMLGYSKEKLIGTSGNCYFILSDFNNTPGKLITSREGLLKKSSGKLIPIILTRTNIKLGEEVYSIESFIDISDRKEMEDALHKAHYELELKVEERTRELSGINNELQNQISRRIKVEEEKLKLYWAVQQSPISIAITDLEGNIEYVNPQFTEMTGFSSEEVLGKNSFKVKSTDLGKAAREKIKKLLINGMKWQGEIKDKKKSGEIFWVSSFISPLLNMKGEISNFLEVDEDINNKKEAEIKLLTAKEKAEESNKFKSGLLSNISHEFRTPLSGILGFTQILMNEITEPRLSGMIKDIYDSGKRLTNTLNGILNLSRLDVMDNALKFNIENLSGFLESIIEPYSVSVKEKFLEFNFEILRKQLYVSIEPELFREAIDCLIDNAIKFTRKGSVTVILDSVYDNGREWAAVKIRDTGIGINPNDFQTIFEPFRQASEGFSRNYEGIGLGLTLAQRIVKAMKGKIKVESSVSRGSTFTILIPIFLK